MKISALFIALFWAMGIAASGQTAQNQASDDTVVVGNPAQPVQWEHRQSIAAAIKRAGPKGTVWIPPTYSGTDCNPIASCSPGTTIIIDLRNGGIGAQVFSGVPSGTCATNAVAVNALTGDFYACVGGAWLKIGPSAAAGNPGGTAGQLQVNVGGVSFGGITPGGDCVLDIVSGNFTCIKTNGTLFAPIATSGSAADLNSGTLPILRVNPVPLAYQVPFVNTGATALSWLNNGGAGCYMGASNSGPVWDPNLCSLSGSPNILSYLGKFLAQSIGTLGGPYSFIGACGSLPAVVAGNGGVGFNTSCIPSINVNGGGWNPIIYSIAGVASAAKFNATTGFQVNGAAPNGHCLIGNGTNYVDLACNGGVSGQVLGQPPIALSPTSFGSITNEFHTDAVGLTTALAACASVAPASCHVVIDPPAVIAGVVQVVNIPSPGITIGNAGGTGSTQSVTVEDRGTTLNCTSTSGDDCIKIGQFGKLVCAGKGPLINNTGCAVVSASNAVLSSLVTNLVKDGTQSDFTLSGMNIAPSLNAIITRAPLWLVAVEGKGTVRDVSVEASAVWKQVAGAPVLTGSSGYGVSLEDGDSGIPNMNVVTFDNLAIIGGGRTGSILLHIMSGASANASGSNYVFNGLSLEDPNLSNGNGGVAGNCIDGNSCMLLIDGSEAWNGSAYVRGSTDGTPVVGSTNHSVTSVTINNGYAETFAGSNAAASYIQIRNARDVEINGFTFSGGPGLANCLKIFTTSNGALAGTSPGSQGAVILNGRVVSTRCTNTINNAIRPYIRPRTVSPNINYVFPGPNNGSDSDAYVVDGSLQLTPGLFSTLPTCAAGVEGTMDAVSDSTTNTWGATITGTGANHVMAYCDGTNWTVAGK